MHSFFIDCQSLRKLRITSVLMIAAIQQRNVGRIKCKGPVNFFSERRYFNPTHAFSRPAPHPLLAIIPSPTARYLYFIQSALCRMCICCVTQDYVAIHEMWKERKSTCSIFPGGPGRLPAPSPRSVGGAVGGGEGGGPGLAWGF